MRMRQGDKLSGDFKQPPKQIPLSKFLEDKLGEVECPVCGSKLKDGDFFYVFLNEANLCLGVNSVGNLKAKDYVVTYQHAFSGNIVGLRCHSCGFNGGPDRFNKLKPQGVIGKVVKINSDWTTLEVKAKRFYVLTENVKRNVQENDIVEIMGIMIDEVEDFGMISQNDIIVQKRGNENE